MKKERMPRVMERNRRAAEASGTRHCVKSHLWRITYIQSARNRRASRLRLRKKRAQVNPVR
jgi:hypothetical protein